jgi:hypothetical protein
LGCSGRKVLRAGVARFLRCCLRHGLLRNAGARLEFCAHQPPFGMAAEDNRVRNYGGSSHSKPMSLPLNRHRYSVSIPKGLPFQPIREAVIYIFHLFPALLCRAKHHGGYTTLFDPERQVTYASRRSFLLLNYRWSFDGSPSQKLEPFTPVADER